MKYHSKSNILPPEAGLLIFGADAAEDDPNLSNYFLKTSTWNKVVNGNALLVLGRKGSGKSAIFKMMSEIVIGDTEVVPVTPRLFALDILNDFNSRYPTSPFNQEIGYTTAWRYSLMLELLLAIENRIGSLKLGGEAGVHAWLRKNVEFDADIVSRTVAFLEKWTIDKVSLAQLSATLSSSSRRGPLVGQEIDATIPDIKKSLFNKKYIIAIDNLDEGWVNKEDARSYLAGLILAAKELSRIRNLNVTIFMRTDMFRVLETAYQHMDKFRQSIEYIQWNATSLARLISLRIQRYFGVKDESNKASWARLFPEKMENRFLTYKHITERTFLRPREIIQFCRLVIDIAAKFKKRKAETRDIRDAEIQYSDWKLNDLSGEYSAYYNNVDKLLECYRRPNVYFSSEELESETKDAIQSSSFSPVDEDFTKISVENVIKLLYQMGFIRAKFRNKSGRWRYCSSSTDPNLICTTVNDWDMHPAFRRKLIIRNI
jgi:energy-coupling factor transporter ATP-binding protein EcfA2